jgi:hypothetical protein
MKAVPRSKTLSLQELIIFYKILHHVQSVNTLRGFAPNGYQLCEGWAFMIRLLSLWTKAE